MLDDVRGGHDDGAGVLETPETLAAADRAVDPDRPSLTAAVESRSAAAVPRTGSMCTR